MLLRLSTTLLVGLAVMACCGCGDGIDRVTAEGVVTYQGNPVADATVTFVTGEAGGITGEAKTGADGKFSISSIGEPGIPVGSYMVSIVKVSGEGFEGATPEEEEKTAEQKQREHKTARSLLPGPRLTGWLDGDVNVVVGEQLQEILVGREVDLGATSVVLNDHGGTAIRRNGYPTDLVLLHSFNEIAVAESAGGRRRIRTIQESRADRDHHDHKQDVKTDVAPTLVQGSLASDEGMLIEILRDQEARSTSTTLLKANHSGISSPLRSILRN